jgi:hypothetical protein
MSSGMDTLCSDGSSASCTGQQAHCLHHQGTSKLKPPLCTERLYCPTLKTKAVCCSESLVRLYHSALRRVPKDGRPNPTNLHGHRPDILKNLLTYSMEQSPS